MKKKDIISKIHLVISVLVVVLAAFVYGFFPDVYFDIYLNTTDELNVFKAIMGMYLGFSFLWVLGIFKHRFLKVALISNVIFMLGIGIGRLLSWAIDGTPTAIFQIGVFGEIILGFYGLWVLNKGYFKNP